jgi:hypothetical protein
MSMADEFRVDPGTLITLPAGWKLSQSKPGG